VPGREAQERISIVHEAEHARVPEPEVGILPDDLPGKDAIELGCETAYVSAWLARRGARVVGIDNSEAQLATARRLQHEYGLDFPLLHGNAEAGPYPGAFTSFVTPSALTWPCEGHRRDPFRSWRGTRPSRRRSATCT